MRQLVIFGTGEYAQVAAVYLRQDSPWHVSAFTVDEAYIRERQLLGIDVVPFESLTESHPPSAFAILVAMGFSKMNQARAEVCRRCEERGYELISYVSSRAITWDQPSIGKNCFIFENNVIQPFVTIGDNTVIWSGNHLGHHAQIGDHCFITSHAVISGGVKIGDHCFIGVNSTIRDHVTVAPRCVIGAGALILKDTQADGVYTASPASLSRVPSHRLKGL